MMTYQPFYIEAFKKGLLSKKAAQARKMLESCTLCPRQCRVDRTAGELGLCRTGEKAHLAFYKSHYGEETPLVGKNGSGAFFFTYCNLLCIFCQNYELSHEGCGREVSDSELADIMMILQDGGCPNIHFITPTHVLSPILSALEIAVQKGLCIPLVYNSSGYESFEVLKLLDGLIDIYMPDFKFWDSEVARRLCNAPDYPEIARQAVKEMHRQVGDLKIEEDGIARRGLLLRHLLMPAGMAGTREVMRFVAQEISPDTYVNIMPQFRPYGRSREIRELMQPIRKPDYVNALEAAREEGIFRIDRRPGRVFMGF